MNPYYADDLVTLFHGDCREIMPEIQPADLVFTDPPYSRDYAWTWSALADVRLKSGCALFAWCGHTIVPEAVAALRSTLFWWWLFIARNKSAPRLFGYRLKATFKPILAFYKDRLPTHQLPGLMPDDLHVAGSVREAKALHEWGQGPVAEPILRFCPPSGLVVDPFAGSGTTLWTAKQHGRRAIGIEVEERHCEIAAERCSQGILPLPVET